MAALALMPCASPSIRATYGVYRAPSVVALDDSLFGVFEGTLIVLGAVVALSGCALAVCIWRHMTWPIRFAASRFPNYAFATLTALHLPMSYAAVVLASGSAGEAPHSQRDSALAVSVVVLIAVPVIVTLASQLLVPRRFHAHVPNAADWVQVRLSLLVPHGHVAPVEVDRALDSVVGKFRVPLGAVAAVPFVPSLLLGAGSAVTPTTVGGCVTLFSALLAAFAALIPLYLLLRPYRWPGLNVACAANTVPVLGLLALMIVELQGRVGAAVEHGIIGLLATQTAFAVVTVALSVAQLLLSARMDQNCLGEVLWTVQRQPRCRGCCLWAAPLTALGTDLRVVASAPMQQLTSLLGVVAYPPGRVVRRAPRERRVALALLVETICGINRR
jgi:hypothetical protein